METAAKKVITVSTVIGAPVEKVWNNFTSPEHIVKWNNASPDWHTPSATNDLREGGNFVYRMEAKDGSFGFDFGGTYDAVKKHQLIRYTIGDGRIVNVQFIADGLSTKVIEEFEAENQNSLELQKTGWQAILDNLKKYSES